MAYNFTQDGVTLHKMASASVLVNTSSNQFTSNSCTNEDHPCVHCLELKNSIHQLTTELETAQLIIKLLQEDLKTKESESTTTVNLLKMDTSFPPSTINSASVNASVNDSITESDWSVFRSKYNKFRPVKKTLRCLKQLTPDIPLNENRFAPLSKFQDDEHLFIRNTSNPHPDSSLNHYAKHKPKVILLGDSHVRGCSEKLSNLFGNAFSVIGYMEPNANVNDIVNSIDLKSEQLSKNDVVILCGGTRDIARNNSKLGLSHISHFANITSNTNVLVMCAPIRYDLMLSSCVNKEISSFNRKLFKLMKLHNQVQLCLMNSNRDHFTTHGLHMNARGKNWLAETWASIIKSLRSISPPTTVIPLPDQSTNPSNDNDSTNNPSHTDSAVFQVCDLNLTINNLANGNQRTA